MKLKNFKLTQRNQNGQVAIFVALIFQVIFIFFAVLINVGLLVHHKINLQQSTDMAAYYGAMKQAEMLNVISHINFQIRQAWKLMTWRYRIMGTFMFTVDGNATGPNNLTLPVKIGTESTPTIRYGDIDQKCNIPEQVNLNNAPIFCIAHSGFGDFNAPLSESPCKVNCNKLNMFSPGIARISRTGGVSVGYGGTVGGAVNAAIDLANTNSEAQCKAASQIVASQFVSIITAYFREVNMRSAEILSLTKNLQSKKDDFIDLNGKVVKNGVEATLKNNLTEANLSSIQYDVMNGLSAEDNQQIGGCRQSTDVFNKIEFKLVQFFLSFCGSYGGNIRNDFFMSPYDLDEARVLPSADLQAKKTTVLGILRSTPAAGSNLYDVMMNLLLNDSFKFTTGFEKNPYCQSYYAVRSRAKPKIPFMPLSQVELTAVSVAKPFGGSVGPWFYDRWQPGEKKSNSSNQVDKNLPLLDISTSASENIKDNLSIIPNYSLFVGDREGLSNRKLIAIYHDLILNKNFNGTSPGVSESQVPPMIAPGAGGVTQLTKPGNNSWPHLKDWSPLGASITKTSGYDPLVTFSGRNSGLRDLEISAIAPNAFDLSYYSIDADFYKNYLDKKLKEESVRSKLTQNISTPEGEDKVEFRPDFGYNENLVSNGVSAGNIFSARHQIAVVNDIFKKNGTSLLKFNYLSDQPEIEKLFFSYVPKLLSSLLTGWTFNNLTNEEGYTSFPKDGAMAFGKCSDSVADETNVKYKSLTEVDGGNKYPPTPGNCVSGGRTGYSVKIVSVEAINGVQEDIGGEGTSGQILNPLPSEFINF